MLCTPSGFVSTGATTGTGIGIGIGSETSTFFFEFFRDLGIAIILLLALRKKIKFYEFYVLQNFFLFLMKNLKLKNLILSSYKQND